MSEELREKLKDLPSVPGVYFHKDKLGEIIYVGKAANLKNRVRQYFQSRKGMDNKTVALVEEIADVDWVEVETELDALFLEGEMVKRYMPRWNVLLRDDKSYLYVRINMGDEVPWVGLTRNPLDDGAKYFGPYIDGGAVKKALRYLRKIFPYYDRSYSGRADLNYHIGLSPGVESGKTSVAEYRRNLRKLMRYIQGGRKELIEELRREMEELAERQEFEKAARARNQWMNLKELQRQIVFGAQEFLDISKDEALVGLKDLLGMTEVPRRIEGFDISHMSGRNVVGSMVVFANGMAERASYRKFKMKERNDDFANMREMVERRLGHLEDWGRPDLVVIDGGVGQVGAVRDLLEEAGLDYVGLAERDEEIIVRRGDGLEVLSLPKSSHVVKLLQRVRDESHRFAVSYHEVLRRKGQVKSALDDVVGVGPKTKALLKRRVGSVAKIRAMSEGELAGIIGKARARKVKEGLGDL